MLGRGVQCQSAGHRGFSHSAFAHDKLELCHKAILQNSPERLWRPNPLLAPWQESQKECELRYSAARRIHTFAYCPESRTTAFGAVNLYGLYATCSLFSKVSWLT